MRHFARADGLHLWNYAEAQHPPDLMFGDVAQTLGQQGSVPAPITRPLGGSSSAARTGRSCSAGLPLRGASARADRPSRAKRPRHLLTARGPPPTGAATAVLPLGQRQDHRCRNAMRRSVLPAARQYPRVARSSLVNTTSVAFIVADYHIR